VELDTSAIIARVGADSEVIAYRSMGQAHAFFQVVERWEMIH
jgi:hypothetical protein